MRTGFSTKTSSNRSIDRSLCPTGRMPRTFLRLWGFLCVRDAGHRGNKIAVPLLQQQQQQNEGEWRRLSPIFFLGEGVAMQRLLPC